MALKNMSNCASSSRTQAISSILIVLFFLFKSEQYHCPWKADHVFPAFVCELVETALPSDDVAPLIEKTSAGEAETAAAAPLRAIEALFRSLDREFSLRVRLRLCNQRLVLHRQHPFAYFFRFFRAGFSDEPPSRLSSHSAA